MDSEGLRVRGLQTDSTVVCAGAICIYVYRFFIKSAFPSVGSEGFSVNEVGMNLLMLGARSQHLEADQASRLRGLYDGVRGHQKSSSLANANDLRFLYD